MSHVLVQIDRRPGAHGSRQSFFSNRSTLFLFLLAELLLLTVPSGAARLYVGLYRSSQGGPEFDILTPEEWLLDKQFFHQVDRIPFPSQPTVRPTPLVSTPLLR